MVVPPKHPKMIISSRKTPWLLGTTILGNSDIAVVHYIDVFFVMPTLEETVQLCHGPADSTNTPTAEFVVLGRAKNW